LYISGLTNLNQTTIITNNGALNIQGSNPLLCNISNSINFTALNSSFFKATTGTLLLQSLDTSSAGIVSIQSSGISSSSISLASSGGITINPGTDLLINSQTFNSQNNILLMNYQSGISNIDVGQSTSGTYTTGTIKDNGVAFINHDDIRDNKALFSTFRPLVLKISVKKYSVAIALMVLVNNFPLTKFE
jgi:hypothetical protein